MIKVNEQEIAYKQGMTAFEAIKLSGEDDAMSVVLVNDEIISDTRGFELRNGSVIRLLRIVSGG